MKSAVFQRGISTVVVAILLLAILSVVSLFALSVGVFEQRTAGNENRARITMQVAESGINHAVEVIKANAARLVRSADEEDGWEAYWRTNRCARNDETFPCGAERDPDRRETLFAFRGGGSPLLVGPDSIIAEPMYDTVGNFDVSYEVGALLCLVDEEDEATPGIRRRCVTPFEPDFDGLVAITLVSRGFLDDDPAARAEIKATVASFRIIGNPPNVPIIASGTVDISGGTADIVPNPNAGGIGVALSIWSGSDVSLGASATGGTGDVKTCHLGEFLMNFRGNAGDRGPQFYQGIEICHDCFCDGLAPEKGLISGKHTAGGAGVGRDYGIDFLFHYDPASPPGGTTPDLPPTEYFPSFGPPRLDDPDDPFDDNLFEYLFGIDVIDFDSDDPQRCVTRDESGDCPDVAYLKEAAQIVEDCSGLGIDSSGLIWVTGNCSLPNDDIGTPREPVFLVVDGTISLQAKTVVYGVLFGRDSGSTDTCTGGAQAGRFCAQGGAIVYGSVVLEGDARVRGRPKFIYNEAVLQNLLNSDDFKRFGLVPGSWTDVVGIPD
ncbi:MAG TPA: pilus assembly PilX N-terminal domain-containing protein [Xanthomonadaceae bacterium]|nr:pilus assembly PilX N-terminal domain-containing protein [Xanthomonadaceae bacterium]